MERIMTIYLGQTKGSITLSDGRELFCRIQFSMSGKLSHAAVSLSISESILEIPSDEITIKLPDGRTGPFVINGGFMSAQISDEVNFVQLECEQSPNWKGWSIPLKG